eukprot:Polyplicarium_translucidae@DN3061_c0_g1_i10.p1
MRRKGRGGPPGGDPQCGTAGDAFLLGTSKLAMDVGDDDDWEADPEYLQRLKEKYKDAEDHPLFMEELPCGHRGAAGRSVHPVLEALQCVQGEQTPDEAAENCRTLGNEAFEEGSREPKRYADAADLYTKGIEAGAIDGVLRSKLHSNRAHVRLLQRKFPECVDDCRRSVEADPLNVKAYYRAARASLRLGLHRQAREFCANGLERCGDNEQLLALKAEADEDIRSRADRKEVAEAEREMAAGRLVAELRRRDIRYLPNAVDVGSVESEPRFDDGELVFTAAFFYPELGSSDCVRDWREQQTLGEMLQVVLNGESFPPGDTKRRYVWDKVRVYWDSGAAPTLHRVSPAASPRRMLEAVRICTNVLQFFVVIPESSAEASLAEEHDVDVALLCRDF